MSKSKQIKTFSSYKKPFLQLSNLVGFQKESYSAFLDKELKLLFEEFFPIVDANERFMIEFVSCSIGKPKFTEKETKERLVDYSGPFKAILRLTNKITNLTKEEEVLVSYIPLMTKNNSFIINGIERTIVSQLVKSSGVRFLVENKLKGSFFGAAVKPIKGHGVWVTFISDQNGRIFVRLDQGTKKIPVTTFIRAFGPQTKEDVNRLFVGDKNALEAIKNTFTQDESNIMDEVWLSLHKLSRSNDSISPEKAKEIFLSRFDKKFYNISEYGRIILNRRSGRPTTAAAIKDLSLQLEDIVFIIKEISRLNNTKGAREDDIDNLAFRRVRTSGELIKEHLRIGVAKMKKNVMDRMITTDPLTFINPTDILNLRIFKTTVQSFFTLNQLSQTLKQKNILDEVEHFRTLSALGVGGLMRDHASVEVRDIHSSHYSRLCPIHTPEGANVGLVTHLSLYARLNKYGLLEAPYMQVKNGVTTGKVDYLSADEEEKYYITSANFFDEGGRLIKNKNLQARKNRQMFEINKNDIEYTDVAVGQILSIATSLIPFVLHNIPVRALYGSTMQRQAIPCLNPEKPIVATGYETEVAKATNRMILAKNSGVVVYVDADKVEIKKSNGTIDEYILETFVLSNSKSFATHQRPVVKLGQKISKNEIIVEIASTSEGQLAIGKNLRVGFMCYDGLNFEDAIVISNNLLKDDKLTSIDVEEYTVDVRETKLGNEIMTADITNVSEYRLRNLDINGIIRIGADVVAGDILVGKITPRGESQLSPEEKLLQSIFGDKAKEMRDTSLPVPPSKRKGRVIDVQIKDRANGDELKSGVIKQVRIKIAELRYIQSGDKLANRHGNKGIISRILPVEDMPYTKDGEPLDVLLTPLGVPSRQNIGQILELHMGLCANKLNYQLIAPPLTSPTEQELENELEKAGFNKDGKIEVYDGRTGEKLFSPVSIGYMYMMKLDHMVEDKMHARSIGPYSLVTQQPLTGRAQFGGQKNGEMEVWAFLGHSASYTLREMLTIKSDDIYARSAAYNSIIKNEPITQFGVPASFNVLLFFLKGLGLNINLISSEDTKNKI